MFILNPYDLVVAPDAEKIDEEEFMSSHLDVNWFSGKHFCEYLPRKNFRNLGIFSAKMLPATTLPKLLR